MNRIIFLQIIQVFADTLSSPPCVILISMIHITEPIIFENGQRRMLQRPGKPDEKQTGVRRASLKALAEAIMLQAIEDLWDPSSRKESIDFFWGEGFTLCADLAGMTSCEKSVLMRIVEETLP